MAAGVAVGPFLHFGLPATAPLIRDELGIAPAQFGVLAAVLALVGGATSPLLGSVADRHGGRRLLVVTFALGGFALVSVGLAPSGRWLFAGAVLAGLSMASGVPATNLLLMRHVRGRRLGLYMGIKQSGIQVGQLVAGALLPIGAVLVGWRSTFVAVGTVALAAALATAWLVPPPAAPDRARDAVRIGRGPVPPLLMLLMAYAALIGAAILSVNTYLPLDGADELGLRPAVAGATVGAIGAVGFLVRLGLGAALSRIREPLTVLAWLGLAGAVAGALFASARAFGTLPLWFGIAFFGVAGGGWNVVAMYVVVRTLPASIAGRASGLVMLGYYAGMTVGPPLLGLLLTATGSYLFVWLTVLALFGAVAVLPPLARRHLAVD